jgi:hypothetical protein
MKLDCARIGSKSFDLFSSVNGVHSDKKNVNISLDVVSNSFHDGADKINLVVHGIVFAVLESLLQIR